MNSFIILVCLCVGSVNYSSASSVVDILKEAGNTVRDWFKSVIDGGVEEVKNDCSCINYGCGCCAYLQEKKIELNSTICVNITYLVHDYGISFTVTVNKYTIFNETVSARNPPPVCLGVPYVKKLVDACIRLYDIDATTTHLHACVRFEARMEKILVAKYNIGCFDIGPPGLSNEGKHVTCHKTSLETNAASSTCSATDMTVIAVAVTVGLALVAVAISVVIVLARGRGLARKRGMKAYCTDTLLKRQRNYGKLISTPDYGSVNC